MQKINLLQACLSLRGVSWIYCPHCEVEVYFKFSQNPQEIALAKNHRPSTMKQSEPSPKTKNRGFLVQKTGWSGEFAQNFSNAQQLGQPFKRAKPFKIFWGPWSCPPQLQFLLERERGRIHIEIRILFFSPGMTHVKLLWASRRSREAREKWWCYLIVEQALLMFLLPYWSKYMACAPKR